MWQRPVVLRNVDDFDGLDFARFRIQPLLPTVRTAYVALTCKGGCLTGDLGIYNSIYIDILSIYVRFLLNTRVWIHAHIDCTDAKCVTQRAIEEHHRARQLDSAESYQTTSRSQVPFGTAAAYQLVTCTHVYTAYTCLVHTAGVYCSFLLMHRATAVILLPPPYLLYAGIGKRRTCHVLSVFHVDNVVVVTSAAHVSDDGVHDHHRLGVHVQICRQETRVSVV